MEGKETRLGIANSVLWGAATTAASNGSVNAMHSSFSPLAGGGAMLNIMLGEVIFGGVDAGLSSRANTGAHGFSEMLYAFTSAAGNNGSAFAGLNANTPFYNLLLGIAMWVGRFGVIVPVLAIAGSMVTKKTVTPHGTSTPSSVRRAR